MSDPTRTAERAPAKPGAQAAAAPSAGARLDKPLVRVGRVNSFTVATDGLRIKLDSSAISRSLIFVGSDEPHYRGACSIALLAFNARYTKDTYHEDPTADHQYISVRIETAPTRTGLEMATAVGLGKEAFNLENWIMRAEDVVRPS